MDSVIPVSQRRRRKSRGAEVIEFTLVFLPMLAFVTVIADTAWAIWAEATLQRAVRLGVRVGVTLTAVQTNDLTDTVKGTVQAYSFGLLNGASGLALIKVHYFQPPAPASNAAATDVSTQPNGDVGGNIMQVSVQNFNLNPLMPRITSWKTAPDKNPFIFSVSSADIIEPSNNPPSIGPAP
ncbi:MAG TPA: TadE family protein [Bryobacteraceae bacterium]|nr:TadE family protein [Bryobacteraceae bacterium]